MGVLNFNLNQTEEISSDNVDCSENQESHGFLNNLKHERFSLRNLRKFAKFKQQDGADVLNIQRPYYSKLENSGVTRISTIIRIADHFGYDIKIIAISRLTGESREI